MAENKTFGCFPITCADDNGGCDPLTICSMVNGTVSCGPCPVGFTGNGTSGCLQINACLASAFPCGNVSTCTFVNLTQFNISSTSCICTNGDCTYVNPNTTFTGSAGKYNCVSYTRIVTESWNASVCSDFQQENGTFQILLDATILSTTLACVPTVRWEISNPNGSLLLWSVAYSQYYDPFFVTFVLPYCTTDSNCTEVMYCNVTGECAIAPGTCYDAHGNEILTDAANISSSNCTVSERVTVNVCPEVEGHECEAINNLNDFFGNGFYICTETTQQGCVTFVNDNQYVLQLPARPPTSTNCSVLLSFLCVVFWEKQDKKNQHSTISHHHYLSVFVFVCGVGGWYFLGFVWLDVAKRQWQSSPIGQCHRSSLGSIQCQLAKWRACTLFLESCVQRMSSILYRKRVQWNMHDH